MTMWLEGTEPELKFISVYSEARVLSALRELRTELRWDRLRYVLGGQPHHLGTFRVSLL